MNKRQNTFIFTLISTVANILMTVAIIAVLIVLATLLLNKVMHVQNGQVYTVAWMICFLAGLVLGMFVFGKLCGMVIDRWFYDKLDDRLLGKYLPSKRKERGEEPAPRLKTNMPQSVLPKEDPLESD